MRCVSWQEMYRGGKCLIIRMKLLPPRVFSLRGKVFLIKGRQKFLGIYARNQFFSSNFAQELLSCQEIHRYISKTKKTFLLTEIHAGSISQFNTAHQRETQPNKTQDTMPCLQNAKTNGITKKKSPFSQMQLPTCITGSGVNQRVQHFLSRVYQNYTLGGIKMCIF